MENEPKPIIEDNAEGESTDNSFDLDKLRIPQDFQATAGVKKVLTVVPVRKPNRQDFIRVHPGEDWRLATAVLEDKENRETLL